MFNKDKANESEATPTYATHAEVQGALSAFLTREDAETHLSTLRDLTRRVEALEDKARYLADHQGAQESTGRHARVVDTTERSEVTTERSALDYGAVAFGLSQIKARVASALGHRSELQAEYAGTVDYFADVFAKSDPDFNRAEFNRLAGK